MNTEKPANNKISSAVQNNVRDQLNRPLHDLRISVTDRCNFRCSYCMPKEVFHKDYQYLSRENILSHEEIIRLAKITYQMGVRKFRLTGGEPLIRRNLEFLIGELAAIDDDADISLTTNGALLTKAKTMALRDAGLKRITISLDALDDALFQQMNDMHFPVSKVLRGIDNAINGGLGPVKINMVVIKGVNEHEIIPMMRYFEHKPVILRFIEFMDVGNSNNWRQDSVFSARQILETLQQEFTLTAKDPNYTGEVASRWQFARSGNQASDKMTEAIQDTGEIGIISSISQPFCSDCHRMRLSAEGKLYTCLFANSGFDVKNLLRSELTDDDILDRLIQLWQQRSDRYSEIRHQIKVAAPKVEMSYIGG